MIQNIDKKILYKYYKIIQIKQIRLKNLNLNIWKKEFVDIAFERMEIVVDGKCFWWERVPQFRNTREEAGFMEFMMGVGDFKKVWVFCAVIWVTSLTTENTERGNERVEFSWAFSIEVMLKKGKASNITTLGKELKSRI